MEDNLGLEDKAVEVKEKGTPEGMAVVVPEPLECWKTLPVEDDGWVRAHNAIRLDMKDYLELVETLKEHAANGKIQDWMGDNLTVWFAYFFQMVHEHHDHEEELFFPEINKRVHLPEKMSADHKTLVALLDESQNLTNGLAKLMKEKKSMEEVNPAIDALAAKFKEFQSAMLPHLKEEEDEGLPLVRAHFTRDDMNKLEKVILKDMDKMSIGWFMRSFKDDAERKHWMRNVAKIPTPVVHFILFPIAKEKGKFYWKYTVLMEEIQKAEKIARPSNACCVVS